MKRSMISRTIAAAGLALILAAASAPPEGGYEVHDRRRPQPVVVTPGTASTQEQPGKAPSDAIVLFGGKDLSQWQSAAGGDAAWDVKDGQLIVAPGKGNIRTKQQFADVQLHVEWMEPEGITGKSQGRGNSGIFLMGLYELQVLDNYQSETYADGMAGSIYGQYPPLVNACRPQGQWQTYDVIFHPPIVEHGKVKQPATETTFLNGILVQDHTSLIGPTMHRKLTSYPDNLSPTGPIELQDHHNPVHYRNIWIRKIPPAAEHPVPPTKSSEEYFYDQKP